jgi:DNA-directed RNA polymerase subunit beta'
MVNSALPPELRDYNRVMTKGDSDNMLAELAHKHPELYRTVSHQLMQLGRNATFEEGTTLRLSDLTSQVDKSDFLKQIDRSERTINADKDSTQADKDDARDLMYHEIHGALKKQTYDDALARGNPLAMQVKSKARGNQDQLAGLMSTPGIYQDSKGRTIPAFIRHSYAEGLDPHEYYAASYGARLGVISTKSGTRQAGYLGKLFGNAVMDQVVTSDDCETPFGIPVKTEDTDNIGSVLAQDAGRFKAGTVISQSVLSGLKNQKVDDVVIRSPITCGTHKGVCKQCVGLREDGHFAPIGYHIGLNATSALAEQLAQNALNVKHSGKKGAGRTYSGFNVVKNLATVPDTFPDSATVAEADGTIESIEPAPQGGFHIRVGGQDHYVAPDIQVTAKVGDTVEAGDALSEGIVNPADVVRLKGIGEGRRYFADRLTQAFRDTNYGVNRRNVEVLARSMVNHVNIDDVDAAGSHLPGDMVTYASWAHSYKPRADAKHTGVRKAVGQYLEAPALHYSIGTRVTKSVADRLNHHGVDQVLTHQQPVGVSPEMVSVVKTPEYSDDWMARLSSSYLKTRLLEDVHTGAVSNTHSVNPIPGLAKGTEFGEQKGKTFTY